ncbi:MAG: orotidine-5'-phosphate decarboxylase [Gammaproteobacteria bacterium]
MTVKAPRVIVALDYSDSQSALSLVDRLDPALCRLKVGKELFTRCGPEIVRSLVERKFDVFLDLKFHDIPNTVARACAAAADLGVWMLNVHAMGGPAMLEAARKALPGHDSPLLIAVTLLTSSGPRELEALGISQTPLELVQRLATITAAAGLDGVVCSSQEAAMLARQHGDDFVLVTPGIRLQGAAEDDQQRVMTPARAVAAGAHYLVIGRPIVQADDPVQTLLTINSEISDS